MGGFCGVTAVLAWVCHRSLGSERYGPLGWQWLAILGLGLGPVGLAFFTLGLWGQARQLENPGGSVLHSTAAVYVVADCHRIRFAVLELAVCQRVDCGGSVPGLGEFSQGVMVTPPVVAKAL